MRVKNFFLRTVYADIWQDDPPSPDALLVVVIRVLNLLVFSGGVVLVIMILLSAYKFSMAQGDPKGVDGAKKTLTYAILGFLLVIGAYSMVALITSLLGVSGEYASVGGLVNSLREIFLEFSDLLNINWSAPAAS